MILIIFNFRYAKIKLNVSDPIVPFRETIINPPKIDMVNEAIQDSNIVSKTSKMKEFEEDEEVSLSSAA